MKTLSIQGTLCKEIPVSLIRQNPLRRIDLSDNEFRKLPLEMFENRNLHYLDLSRNRYSIDEKFISKINSIENLRYLKVDVNVEAFYTQDRLNEKGSVRAIPDGHFEMAYYFGSLIKTKNVHRFMKFQENRHRKEKDSYSTKNGKYYCYFISRTD